MPHKIQRFWLWFGGSCVVVALGLLVVIYSVMPPRHSSFQVGMSKTQLLARFGQPAFHQDLVKGKEFIINELFLNDLPEGTAYEIWTYKSLGGVTWLFFINHEDVVSHSQFGRPGKTDPNSDWLIRLFGRKSHN